MCVCACVYSSRAITCSDPSKLHNVAVCVCGVLCVCAGMEGVVDKGLARNNGISNFCAQAVMDLLKYARIRPAVNQVCVCVCACVCMLCPYLRRIAIAPTF